MLCFFELQKQYDVPSLVKSMDFASGSKEKNFLRTGIRATTKNNRFRIPRALRDQIVIDALNDADRRDVPAPIALAPRPTPGLLRLHRYSPTPFDAGNGEDRSTDDEQRPGDQPLN
jgi:hypothetical protein